MNHIDARELAYRASYWGTNSGHWGPALMYLAALARNARNVLEIGVWTGGSTRAFLAALQNTEGRLTSIDIDPECAQRVGERPRWDFRCGDSITELAKLHSENYRCDFALVDGEHTYDYTRAELRYVDSMLEDGGIIVVDDVWEWYPGTARAFREFNPSRQIRKTLIRYGWDEPTVGGGERRTFGLIEYAEPVPQTRKLLIAIQTHPGSAMPRACRETWIPRARELGFEVLFYSGSDQPCCGNPWVMSQSGDTLSFPVQKNYQGQCDRANALTRWAVENRPESWVFRIDDDTLVLPDRLNAMLSDAGEYHGFPLDLGPGTTRYASGGAGFLCSPYAVRMLAERGIVGTWDDVGIGDTLLSVGVPLTEDMRFRPFRNTLPEDHNEPTRENAYVTCHCKSPGNDPVEDRMALMRRLWKDIYQGETGCLQEEEQVRSDVAVVQSR